MTYARAMDNITRLALAGRYTARRRRRWNYWIRVLNKIYFGRLFHGVRLYDRFHV